MAAAREKGLFGDMQHGRAVFTDGIKHDRIVDLRDHFAHNLNTFRFQLL